MNRLLLLLCCVCWCYSPAQAQFLTLVEESTTGKHIDTIPTDKTAIVDINSRIRIRINAALLEDEMFRFQGVAVQDSRLVRLKKLNQLLRHQNAILEMLNTTFSDRDKTKIALRDYQKFATLLDDLMEEIENDDELIELIDNPEMDMKALDFDGPYPLFLIDFLEQEAQAVRESLLADLGTDGQIDSSLVVYFRLGAFIKNKSGGRPIHIENFDDYVMDEYFEIERFGTPLGEDEKIEIARNKSLNDSIQINNLRLGGHFKELVRLEATELFPSDSSRINLKRAYKRALGTLSLKSLTKPAAQVLLNNELSLEQVNRLYNFSISTYKTVAQGFPDDLLENNTFTDNLDELVNLALGSYKSYAEDVSLYATTTNSFLPDGNIAGLPELSIVEKNYAGYVDSLETDIKNIKNIFTRVLELLQPFKKSYLENEEFTAQVRRFMVGNMPAEGFIELKGIGERKAGDEILIKAVLERGTSKKNPNYESREIYRRYVHLARVSPYFRMSGSLVLANPYARAKSPQVALANKFQFAPTYGIFMKWGSRKSKFYNDFINLGVGMGFTSPDFDLDGTPEFGAGLMITGMRDILSVGWGWNFGLDTPYSFIGFNLPFTVGALPNSATSSTVFGN